MAWLRSQWLKTPDWVCVSCHLCSSEVLHGLNEALLVFAGGEGQGAGLGAISGMLVFPKGGSTRQDD